MSSTDFATAQRLLAARVSQDALQHSLRSAETAAELARIYGVDVEKARLAGLLHDWDRELGHEELLERARLLGVPVTAVDETVPYLLHARVGAADLKEAFPDIEPEILQAVERHTLGSPAMSDLDRVTYLSDTIEPGRDYPGANELRAAVGSVPLDELFVLAYVVSVKYVVAGRRHMHPETVAVWNALVARELP